jgi:hypothetical protein
MAATHVSKVVAKAKAEAIERARHVGVEQAGKELGWPPDAIRAWIEDAGYPKGWCG